MSENLTPSERSIRARLAAHKSWANTTDPTRRTQAARDSFLARFEDQVDPDRTLPVEQRRRMAESARRAHMSSLAFKSAKARRKGSQAQAQVQNMKDAS